MGPVQDVLEHYGYRTTAELLRAFEKEKTLPAYCTVCCEDQGEDKRWTRAKHCPDCGCDAIYTIETLNMDFKCKDKTGMINTVVYN